MKMKQDQRLGGLGGLVGRAWVVFENWMEHHLFVLMRFYFEHFKVDLLLMVLRAYIEISTTVPEFHTHPSTSAPNQDQFYHHLLNSWVGLTIGSIGSPIPSHRFIVSFALKIDQMPMKQWGNMKFRPWDEMMKWAPDSETTMGSSNQPKIWDMSAKIGDLTALNKQKWNRSYPRDEKCNPTGSPVRTR